MVARVKSHQDLLRVLQKARPPLRRAILKESDKGIIHCICEICENTLVGNVRLSPLQKKKLEKHKAALRRVVKRGETWKKKKQFLVQKGGAFLPLLLGNVLGSLLSSAF